MRELLLINEMGANMKLWKAYTILRNETKRNETKSGQMK